MPKKDSEEKESKDKSKKDEPKEKKSRAKKVDYEGSRWSALGLLIFTVLIGFFLYLSGQH